MNEHLCLVVHDLHGRRLGAFEIPEHGQVRFSGRIYEVVRCLTPTEVEAVLAGHARGNGATGAPLPAEEGP